MKYLKSRLPKGNLLNTAISLILLSLSKYGFYVDEICILQCQYHQIL